MDATIVLACAISILIGMLLNELFNAIFKTSGILKIDHSNPEKDTYRFEIADLDSLSKKKHIFLKVDNDADLSQK